MSMCPNLGLREQREGLLGSLQGKIFLIFRIDPQKEMAPLQTPDIMSGYDVWNVSSHPATMRRAVASKEQATTRGEPSRQKETGHLMMWWSHSLEPPYL